MYCFYSLLCDLTNELPEYLISGSGDLDIGIDPALNSTDSSPNNSIISSYSGANSSTLRQHLGSVSSAQPVSTSGDSTPTMPSVSTPMHSVDLSASVNQMSSISMHSSMNSTAVHHNQSMNHALARARFSNNFPSYMGGGSSMSRPPHIMAKPSHIMASCGPSMSSHLHPEHNCISGPMRVMDMSGQSPHGMVRCRNQMQMSGMMGRWHDMRMNPRMIGINHLRGGMALTGEGHQYMNHPQHHVIPGNHPGMHSMMGGPGGEGMQHQTPMGFGIAPSQGMMNMPVPSNAVGSHMGLVPPPHRQMRPGMNVMMHSTSPRPQASGMPTGIVHF